jgi:hypothetical protein
VHHLAKKKNCVGAFGRTLTPQHAADAVFAALREILLSKQEKCIALSLDVGTLCNHLLTTSLLQSDIPLALKIRQSRIQVPE